MPGVTGPAIVAVGEGMLELSKGMPGLASWHLQHGGDTLNAATYLARLGHRVGYLTALGRDNLSCEMRRAWAEEGIDTTLVLTHPDKLPGLYLIETDLDGERTFLYWRENSAARALFECEGADAALAHAARADCLYLSGITLSLFDERGRERLAELCKDVRDRGGMVVFDPNYRPRGWWSNIEAQAAIARVAPSVSIALPTLADEDLLYGDGSVEACRSRWNAAGVREVAIKLGGKGVVVCVGDLATTVSIQENMAPRDTTGAGDAFNAAYLSARLAGRVPVDAARAGNALAAEVVRHPGAIISRTAMLSVQKVLTASIGV